jgi:hypothetical protein
MISWSSATAAAVSASVGSRQRACRWDLAETATGIRFITWPTVVTSAKPTVSHLSRSRSARPLRPLA